MPDPVGRRRTPGGRTARPVPGASGKRQPAVDPFGCRTRSVSDARTTGLHRVFIARRWAAGCTDGIRKEEARWRRGGGTECGSLPEQGRRATTEPVRASREPARGPGPGQGRTGRSKSGTLRRRCTEEPRDRGGRGCDRRRRRHVRSQRRPHVPGPPRRGGHCPGHPFPQPGRVRAHVPARPDDVDADRATRVRWRRETHDGGRTGPRCPARTTVSAQAAPGCLRT